MYGCDETRIPYKCLPQIKFVDETTLRLCVRILLFKWEILSGYSHGPACAVMGKGNLRFFRRKTLGSEGKYTFVSETDHS